MDCLVFVAKRMLVRQIIIGIEYSDNEILSIAASVLDSSDEKIKEMKKSFLNDIHEMSRR